MPFSRPTFEEIRARVEAGLASRLGLPGILRGGPLAALAAAIAGESHGAHGHLNWNADQLIPDTADGAELSRWTSIWGFQRKAATKSSGLVTFTGVHLSIIPAGTLIRRQDGTEYLTDAEAAIIGSTVDIQVTASISGAAANDVVGMVLTLVSPVAGIESAVTVSGLGLVNGADQESDTSLRDRFTEFLSTPPMGGADQDYVLWSKEVSDVTRAWAFGGLLGLGTVSVYFTVDDNAAGPIPDAGKIAEVQAYIEDRRPVTAAVSVFAPIATDLDPDITLIGASTAAIQAEISSALTDLLRRDGIPGGTIKVSRIREAISTAAGEVDHILVSPSADVVLGTGAISVLGTITWS